MAWINTMLNRLKSKLRDELGSRSQLAFANDKRNTLLLVLACTLVVLNHVGNLFAWISISTISVMLWRVWLTVRGKQLPSRWILLPIAVALMVGIFWQFRSFFGRETGVAMLVLLLSCKMLEMHAKRDLFVVLFLGFFLLLASFFESQSIATAMKVAVAAFTLLIAQVSFQYHEKIPSLWQRAKLVIVMLGIATPITVLSFFLFPRIQGPLWGLPGDANTARSGLSTSMSPGNISKLAMSEELVFRVNFLNKVPEKSQLYWRAVVLSNFDGRQWRQGRNYSAKDERDLEISGDPISQEITLEPSGTHYLFGLDSVLKRPFLEGKLAGINSNGELFSDESINNRVRYRVQSYLNYKLNSHADSQYLQTYLSLPYNFNPLTRNFAQDIRQRYPDQKSQVDAVLNFFRTEQFFYTLEPPLLGRNSVDDFLFNTRAGFCEHYSSAFVVVMRALGIPSRVVTGYQGGTLNTQDQFYEIRQSDAHAWAEVWLAEKGWVRVDPTASVAPERILQNLKATQSNTGFASMVGDLINENAFSREMRMRWSAINNSWNQWILNYNQTRQSQLLDSLGFNGIDWEKTLLAIFAIGLITVASLALPLLRRSKKLPLHDSLYLSLCDKLAKKGIPRALHEGPIDYLQRLQSQFDAQEFSSLQEFFNLYIAIKYGKLSESHAAKPFAQTKDIQTLRSHLKNIQISRRLS
jgi:transglutaminase-like putative cysteine protease